MFLVSQSKDFIYKSFHRFGVVMIGGIS